MTSSVASTSTSVLHASLCRHGAELLALWLGRAAEEGWLRHEPRDGFVAWPEQTSRYVNERIFPPAPEPLPPTDSAVACLERFEDSLEEALGRRVELAERWMDLRQRQGLSAAEFQVLALLAALSTDYGLARAFRYAWADYGRWTPPLGFLIHLLSLGRSGDEVLASLDPLCAPLWSAELVELEGKLPLLEQGVVLPAVVRSLLLGHRPDKPSLLALDALVEPPARLESLLRLRLRASRRNGLSRVWGLVGSTGSGHLAVAGQIARGLAPTGLVPLDARHAWSEGTLEASGASARRAAVVQGAALFVEGLDALPAELAESLGRKLVSWSAATRSPLLFALRAEPEPWLGLQADAILSLGHPDRQQRRWLWRDVLPEAATDELVDQLAGQFLLTEGQIEGIGQELGAEAPTLHELAPRARRHAALGLGHLATPEASRVQMEQLVVDDSVQTLLEEIVSYARHRRELVSRWGFGQAMPYGMGVTMLFTGPPGTGKTLAALAVATALELELYRVDLSQLVSKYIGETEKHLAELFAAAEAGEVMLLFDEADSLFGKRTEVKSSTDRYANLEVNYLLQRMERYDGVVALTTNFEAGIDEAFVRRIRFTVRFDAPAEAARRRLWSALIPDSVPLHHDVDLDLLASEYELTGGHIKEVVLRAAALAFERRQEVDHDLLVRAAEAEYRKLGKLTRQD